MGALPRPELPLRPFHPRAFATVADRTVTDGTDHIGVQLLVPKPHTDGRDLDAVGHVLEYPSL